MMKKAKCAMIITVIACMAFALCPSGSAQGETVLLDYDKLIELTVSGNPAYQREIQEIHRLELVFSDMGDDYRDMQDLMSSLGLGLTPIEMYKTVADLRKSLDATYDRIMELKGELERKAIKHSFPAQVLYINHYILEIDLEIAQRNLGAYERQLVIAKLLLSLGLSTARDVRNAEREVEEQEKTIKGREESMDDNLEALGKLLGISTFEMPDEMPQMDFDRIVERDLEADIAAYIKATAGPEEKALQDARYACSISNTAANRYILEVATQDFERAKKEAEDDFPKVYNVLLEEFEDFSKTTSVADAQEDYDSLCVQYESGLASKNALLAMELALENTKSAYELQRIGLWLLLLEFEYSLV